MAIWNNLSSRGNVEDRRGNTSRLAIGGGGVGIVGVALMLLFNFLGGGDVTDVLTQLNDVQVQTQQATPGGAFEGEDDYEIFASTVLGSNNDMWRDLFAQQGKTYTPPRLVLFRNITDSECGTVSSDVGPNYCPYDQTIYLDETFFEELRRRFGGSSGDVAQAYVISHEAGHHAQTLLGIMGEVTENNSNDLSVKLELQADCFAGLWAYSIKDQNVFESGEVSEALDAAAAVGDDRIQTAVTGKVNPETWTHGSSASRVDWFNKGYTTGSLAACNTFE